MFFKGANGTNFLFFIFVSNFQTFWKIYPEAYAKCAIFILNFFKIKPANIFVLFS
jgi:hypothetical protein